jgi:hypothetical protein
MGAPVLQTNSHGFPAQFNTEIYNLYPNQQGDNVNVTVAAGDTLIAIALGLKDYDPFDLLHGSTTAPGYLLGINDYNPNPIISDGSSDAATITNFQEDSVALTLTKAQAHVGPLTLTQVVDPSGPFTLTSVDASIGSSAVYHGTITGGDSNNFAGMSFVIAGFTGGTNNGTFLCSASSATTLTLANAAAVLETHAATATNSVATDAVYVGAITGGAGNALAGNTFVVTGFGTGANNGTFVAVASTATTLVLTNAARVAETHAGAAEAGVAGAAVYYGTITGGAANALAGYKFTVAGFVTAANNGYFLATSSSATQLVLSNSAVVTETHAGTATPNIVTITAANNFNVGDTVTFSGVTVGTWMNGQSQAVVTASGTQFTTNDSALHATVASTPATGTASRTSGNDWILGANLNQFGSDYTVSVTPPAAPNPYPSVKWSLDGYLPSMIIWSAVNVSAGTYNVNLNSMFQTGTVPQYQYGRPIFDGGVNFMVIKFTGMTAAVADGNSISTSSSTANPAVGPAIVTTGTGDLVLAVAIQKSANGMGLGPTDGTLSTQYQRIANGKLVGSEAHYLVEYGIQTGAGSWVPSFANPLGYETLIAAIAIKHS